MDLECLHPATGFLRRKSVGQTISNAIFVSGMNFPDRSATAAEKHAGAEQPGVLPREVGPQHIPTGTKAGPFVPK